MIDINDFSVYNAEMLKSLYDKIGFVDKIFEPVSFIVDFGCADGAITKVVAGLYPQARVLGFDFESVLRQNRLLGDDAAGSANPQYTFRESDITAALASRNADPQNGRSLLIMNSVAHEIYNYEAVPEEFFRTWLSMGFDYIWIRDMFIVPGEETEEHLQEIRRITDTHFADTPNYKDFRDLYGEPNAENFVHWLLKHRFRINMSRELREDYTLFGRNYNSFRNLYKALGYEVAYELKYVLPFVEYINKKDYGYDLDAHGNRTHIQLVLRKR